MGFDPGAESSLPVGGPIEEIDPVDQGIGVDKTFPEKRSGKVKVLPAAGDELRDDAIVRLEAQSAAWFGVGCLKADESLAPAGWQGRGRDADALGVVAVGLVELR